MIRILLLMAALCLVSCGNPFGEESRRGGGIEIPNGIQSEVAIRLTDSSGASIAYASLEVVAGESWAMRIQDGRSVVLDTLTADSLGVVVVPVTETRVFLLSRHGIQGVFLPVAPGDSAGHNRSNPLPVAMGRLGRLDVGLTAGTLAFFGTPWSRRAGPENAVLHFDSVPQGEYMPVLVGSGGLGMGQTLSSHAFDTTTDVSDMVFSDPDNLMIGNFQNRRLIGIWDPVHVGGYWWATARVDGVASWDYFGMQELNDMLDSSDGNVFAGVSVDFPDTGETVANFGLDFSTDPVNTDLSKANRVSFVARGRGSWTVYVQTQDPDGGNSLRWKHILAVNETWQSYRISFSDFRCEEDSALVWSAATRYGTNLFWQTSMDGNLQVDDIVFEGFRFEDWVDP